MSTNHTQGNNMTDQTQTDLNLDLLADSTPTAPAAPLTAGQWLVNARQASGMSAQDVASRTNRDLTQIMALEADDFSRINNGVMLRAIVRHYAKIVGANQDEAVQHLPTVFQNAQPKVPEALVRDHPSRGAPLKSPWIARSWLILLALLVFGLLAYWVFASRYLNPTDGVKKVSEPNQVVVNNPAPISTPTAPEVAADGTVSTVATIDPATATNGDGLVLNFKSNSWVEIKDADNKVLLSGEQMAGSSQSVVGTLPLTVKIGNADKVEALWKGAAVDLAPNTKGNVARLNLE